MMRNAYTVHLGNFDVEEQWAEGEPGLPAPTTRTATAVAAAAGELALMLGSDSDLVVLKHQPEDGLLEQFDRLGLPTPRIAVAERMLPDRVVTRDVLDSPVLMSRLADAAAMGARLRPHGYAADEALLCESTGLAAPMKDHAVAKRINGKVYSRRLCADLGIVTPPGWECETVDDLAGIAAAVAAEFDAGRRVGFKSSYGVSGKGIMVCDSAKRFDQLVRMLTRRAERGGDRRLEAVVEVWQDKAADLNYHFTIGDDGAVSFDFALEAITVNGVHRGHRLPDVRSAPLREALERTAHRIGERLAAEGYRGPVGVDAITCRDGTLFPVLEINARNNMSTYLTGVVARVEATGSAGIAVQVDLSLRAPERFERIAAALGDLTLTPDWRRGFLVTCSASLNAAAGLGGDTFRGRLHGVAIGADADEANEIERAVRERLGTLEERHA